MAEMVAAEMERSCRLGSPPVFVIPIEAGPSTMATMAAAAKESAKRAMASWRVLAESGEVRDKFLRYNPEDIEEIDDADTLVHLKKCYFPSSQPHNNFEFALCELMHEAILNRLCLL